MVTGRSQSRFLFHLQLSLNSAVRSKKLPRKVGSYCIDKDRKHNSLYNVHMPLLF